MNNIDVPHCNSVLRFDRSRVVDGGTKRSAVVRRIILNDELDYSSSQG